MILQLTAAIQTAVMIEQAHIVITVEFSIYIRLIIKIFLIKEEKRINCINICKTSSRLAVIVDCLHFFIKIL